MCGDKKSGHGCGCGDSNCSCSSKQGGAMQGNDKAAHLRLMEILERIEDRLDELDQKVDAIGMALFDEIEAAGEEEDEDQE